MPTYEVTVQGSVYDVDAPDENTAWAWANQTHQAAAPKPVTPIERTPLPKRFDKPFFGLPSIMGGAPEEPPAPPLLEQKPATPPPALPTTSFAPVTPEIRKAAQAAWNLATPEQREAMQNQPGWRGQLAREQAGLIEGINPEATTSTMAKFDPRVEARKQQLLLKGEDPRFAETTAREATMAGVAPGREIEFLQRSQGLMDEGKNFRPGESLSSMVDVANAAPVGEQPTEMGEITGNALMRGALQTKGIGAALLAAGAKSVGANDVSLSLFKDYFTNTAAAKQYPSAVENFTKIDSWGDVPVYALEGVLENLPQLVGTIGAGTIGSVLAKKAGARAVADMVAEQAAKELIKRQAMGAALGAGATAIGMEVGSIYGDVAKDTKQERPGVALAFGTIAGALDAIPAMRAARTLLTPEAVRWSVKEIGRRYGKEAGIQLATEGGTEFLQTWVEKAATSYVDGRSLLTKENLIEAVDAFLKGGVSGTAIGVATKAASDIANRQANRALGITEKAETEAEAAKARALGKWANIMGTPTPRPPAPVARPVAAAPPTPSAQGVIPPDQAARLAELTQQYIAAGIEETNAGLMALAVVRKEAETAAEQAAPPAVAPAPPAPPAAPPTPVQIRAAEIEDELINAGVPPAQAKIDALAKAQQEEADDAAAAKAEEEPPAPAPTPAPPAPTPAPPAPTPAPPAPTPAPPAPTPAPTPAPPAPTPAPTPAPPAPTPAPTPAPAPAPVAAPVTVTSTRITRDAEGKLVSQLTLSNGASETLFSIDGKWHGQAAGYLADTKKGAIEELTKRAVAPTEEVPSGTEAVETKQEKPKPKRKSTKAAVPPAAPPAAPPVAPPAPPETTETPAATNNEATPDFFDGLALPQGVPIRKRLAGKDVTSEETQEVLARHAGLKGVSKTTKEAIEKFLTLVRHFTPGNIVTGYGGADKVKAFNWNNGNWSVDVQEVKKQPAGNWVEAGRVRKHNTDPGKDGRIVEKAAANVKDAGAPSVDTQTLQGWGSDIAPQMSSIGAAPVMPSPQWFGDSKVASNNGEPLVVYTGTSKDIDFSTFKIPKNGVWFTTDPNSASQYALENDSKGYKYDPDVRTYVETNTASRVIPVFLRITNPATLSEADNLLMRKATNYRRVQGQIFDRLRAQGHDGVDLGGGVWVVLKEANQIKSAIGNRGTYSESPNMLYSSIGAAPSAPKGAATTPTGDTTISVSASSNVKRLIKMLGSKLYGTPQDIAKVSVKELFQNSFDAIKESIDKAQLAKGKIDVTVTPNTRTITLTDNGMGMPSDVMGNQFLQIAGTVKGTDRASGGLGIAKMLFLFENKKLEVVSLRDGVVSRMVTSGGEIAESIGNNPATILKQLEEFLDPDLIGLIKPQLDKLILEQRQRSNTPLGPQITISRDPETVQRYIDTLFPDGHGTSISVEIPKSYTNPSTGEEVPIDIPYYDSNYPVLVQSPLFDNIDVTFTDGGNTKTDLPIGDKFPIDEYSPLQNVKFDWGIVRVYVSNKEKKFYYGQSNSHVLSNGLWQFDINLEAGEKRISRNFFIDVATAKDVKPEDPGYPFDLNRQNFSKQAQSDFKLISDYIGVMYSQANFAESVKNFGTVQYVNADGMMTPPVTLEPNAPPSDTALTLMKPTDKVEVTGGVMYVNDRAVPELTTKDLEAANIKIEELTIPQDQLDTTKPMAHDNTQQSSKDAQGYKGLTDAEVYERFLRITPGTRDSDLPNGGVKIQFYSLENNYEDLDSVEADSVEDMVSHLRDVGLIPDPNAAGPSLSDVARAKFGDKRFNKYIAGVGNTFITLRNILVENDIRYTQYKKDLKEEVIGTSIDIEYYGVSTIIPFRGMFINPATTKMTGNARQIATNMMGTMAHELAHFMERNHNADFASELQYIINTFDSFDNTGDIYIGLKKDLTAHIEANRDIFDFLNKEFTDGNFEPRGNRFKDAGYEQIGDEGTLGNMASAVPTGGQPGGGVPQGSSAGTQGAGQVSVPPGNASQTAPAGVAGIPGTSPPVQLSAARLARNLAIAKRKFELSKSGTEAAEAANLLYSLRDGGEFVQFVASSKKAMSNKALSTALFFVPGDVVASWGSSWLGNENLNKTNDLIGDMRGMQHGLLKAAGMVSESMVRAIKADPALRAKLERVIYESTTARADPTIEKRDPYLNKLYADLGPEGQRIYNEVKTYYASMVDYYSYLLDEQINAANLPGGAQKLIMAEIKKLYEVDKRIVPYFPLVRNRGDFWLRIGQGKKKEFYTFGTVAERDAVMREAAKRMGISVDDMLKDKKIADAGDDLTSYRIDASDSSAMLRDTFAKIDSIKNTGSQTPAQFTKTMEDLKDSIYDLFLTTMPDQSFRKSFIERKDIIGYNVDIVRNFSTSAMHMASQLSRIAYSTPLRNSLLAAQKSLEGNPNKPQYERFVQEMSRRVRLELHPFENPPTGISKDVQDIGAAVGSFATRLSFLHYLSSASSALIQLSAVPYGMANLGARHGYTETAVELAKLTRLWKEFDIRKKNADGSMSIIMPRMSGLNADEERALRDMGRRGVDITFTNEMLGQGRLSSAAYQAPLQKVGRGVMTVAGGLFHNAERMSREIIYMTSYRLSRKAGKTHEQAVDQAVADTYDSAGNMAEWNRAPVFRGVPGRVALQFLSYPLFMTMRLTTTFAQMMPLLSNQHKAQAFREFAGILGVTWMLAGAVGLPTFSLILGAVGAILNAMEDKDKPEDLKSLSFITYFKQVVMPRILGDIKLFGKPVSDLALYGPVNFFTGIDSSSRTTLNDLWIKDHITTKTPREGAIQFAIEHAGPSVNLMLSYLDAFKAYKDGDIQKFGEKILPAMARGPLAAFKYYQEGAKGVKGETLMSSDSFTVGALLAQGIGFRSSELANLQSANFKTYTLGREIINERNNIIRNIGDSHLKKDTARRKRWEAEQNKFNKRFPIEGLEITKESIENSLTRIDKARSETWKGIALTPQNLALFMEAAKPTRDAVDWLEKEGKKRKEEAAKP